MQQKTSLPAWILNAYKPLPWHHRLLAAAMRLLHLGRGAQLLAVLLLPVVAGCGIEVEKSAASLSPTDPLYVSTKAMCGQAPILRVLETDEEIVCCLTYPNNTPALRCIKTSGEVLTNSQQL